MANANNDLFASLVSDIKTYAGKDPLLPWIRGIRKMKDSLPPQVLKEKLPRFLQKCAQTFESDRRYRSDLRYLRVWLQLMDFVDDPRTILKAMESNCIGTKHSLFYQAYALYYEKSKKFDEAERMYHLGVQNLAEPADELQKSYDQFLHRVQRHKKRMEKTTNRNQCDGNISPNDGTVENNENKCQVKGRQAGALKDEFLHQMQPHDKEGRTKKLSEGGSQQANTLIESNRTKDSGSRIKHQDTAERGSHKLHMSCSDDTVVVKFVGTAIDGRSEAENACHHGLVDPTINMKEAMNAINSMFSEPLDTVPVGRSRQRRPKNDGNPKNGFEVFIDEDLDRGIKPADKQEEKSFPLLQHSRVDNHRAHQEPLIIFVDGEENDKIEDENLTEDNTGGSDIHSSREDHTSASQGNAYVFPTPKDLSSESSDDMDVEGPSRPRFREDTVVCRFVGSTISDEPEVENVCHHGLVDPTINLKEAMEDINNMFGKPIDFVRARRSKKLDKVSDMKSNFGGGFTILADDVLEHKPLKPVTKSLRQSRGCDLFEPTMVTKEAIDEINKMFGMPLDF